MKYLVQILAATLASQAFANPAATIKIDVSKLCERNIGDIDYGENYLRRPPKTCDGVQALQSEVRDLNVKLIWKKCVLGSKREVFERSDVFMDNPDYNPEEKADYSISEEVKCYSKRTAWALGAGRYIDGGYYSLKDLRTDAEVKRSEILGEVIVGGSSMIVSNATYRPKHFKRRKELMELIEFAIGH